MKSKLATLTLVGAFMMAANPAQAADQTGEELTGRMVDVQFADGTKNTVNFGTGGVATITSADGSLSNARWFVNDQQLCLQMGTVGECWGYTERFEAGRAVSLSSSCDMTSQWTARSVNPIRQVAPPVEQGERG